MLHIRSAHVITTPRVLLRCLRRRRHVFFKQPLTNPQHGLQRWWYLNLSSPSTQCPTSTPQNTQWTKSPRFVKKNLAAASWFTSMKGTRQYLNDSLRKTSLFKFNGWRFILLGGDGSWGMYTSSLDELNSVKIAGEWARNSVMSHNLPTQIHCVHPPGQTH